MWPAYKNYTSAAAPADNAYAEVIELGPSQLLVSPKIFLEGGVSGTGMVTTLKAGGLVPLTHPYHGSPWNYAGTEAVGAIPANVVDWVLVQLRSNLTTTVATRAAFVLNTGVVVDLDGANPVSFPGIAAGSYYIVIRHRTHLAVMSAATVALSASPTSYDFSTALSQAYSSTTAPMKLVGTLWSLFSGDTNGDGQVNATDNAATWNARNTAGYLPGDVTLDGQVNASDDVMTWNNRNIVTQLP
jgi:hypothetical protein